MRKFIAILWIMLAVAGMMTVAVGCKRKANVPTTTRIHSTVSGSAAGHAVKADMDGAGGITGQNGTNFVQLPGHELGIEQERLLLDGKQAANIPAGARLEIVLSNTTLTVTADGTNVLNTTITR
jgi:hypothetical protein